MASSFEAFPVGDTTEAGALELAQDQVCISQVHTNLWLYMTVINRLLWALSVDKKMGTMPNFSFLSLTFSRKLSFIYIVHDWYTFAEWMENFRLPCPEFSPRVYGTQGLWTMWFVTLNEGFQKYRFTVSTRRKSGNYLNLRKKIIRSLLTIMTYSSDTVILYSVYEWHTLTKQVQIPCLVLPPLLRPFIILRGPITREQIKIHVP